MISGIIESNRVNLPQICLKESNNIDLESKIQQKERWLDNLNVDTATFYLPFVRGFLRVLSKQPLIFMIDVSAVGKGFVVLMISVVYKSRSIPIVWKVLEGEKGHLPQREHMCLMMSLNDILQDTENEIIILGDGEFDGTSLQRLWQMWGWKYAVRTAKDTKLYPTNQRNKSEELKIGQIPINSWLEAHKQSDGNVINAYLWHEAKYDEPIALLTNLESGYSAQSFYSKRFLIETFFSDQKSRGFFIHKTRLKKAHRIDKILICTCLAYIWLVCLGDFIKKDIKKYKKIARKDRKDISLFQIGLRWLKSGYFRSNHLLDNIQFSVRF
jgi:Transposase DDE domain